MLNIICALLGHHRSKRHRKPVVGIWKSQCCICGTQMERIGPGQWLPVSERPGSARRRNSREAAGAD